ncbi:MAG TPA: hypothetical protein PLP34_04385 [Chitinophagaceae bacterium]|nr:hypothetical protein [Chitinophagaceae bacterium]HNF71626.1 hypothetical protein [Chitinophagaceae bacterium]
MKKHGLFLLFILSAFALQAQIQIKGGVYDTLSLKPLSAVSIENVNRHKGCFSDSNGRFSIEADWGDVLLITHLAYNRRFVKVKLGIDLNHLGIYLSSKSNKLKPVVIRQGLSQYQIDSLERAQLYKEAFTYEQQKSVFSPISSLYQRFSRKYKNLRHFQAQIIDIEKQKFIDTRYTPELVHVLTKLENDELALFMTNYPMEYDYARAATDLEIKMWIKYNFQDYLKKNKRPATPNKS